MTPLYKGYCFAVWAPHADEVAVLGSFNGWDRTTHRMERKKDGTWVVDIPEAEPGDEYKYLIVNSGKEYLRNDPYARRVTRSGGSTVIKKTFTLSLSEHFRPPLPNKMVIYELHIGTFGKSDDHTDEEEEPGTLKNAIERLSYLKELGINAVEIMPLAEFSGGYSWGYNPSQIFAVESHYGLPRTFHEFVREAHRLEIAVILDVVYNHLGPDDLDLWQFDGWSENNLGGIYFYNDRRAKTPWGETRPDYGRQEVREYIRDNALMWIKEYDIDGLRWDMTAYIRNVHGRNEDPDNDLHDGWSLMQWVNKAVKNAKPGTFTIAEDLQNNAWLTKPEKEGGAGFDAQWAANFVHPVRKNLTEYSDEKRDMNAVKEAILHRYHGNAFERVIYTESHDEVSNGKVRVPEEVDPGSASSFNAKKKSALGAVLVFTAPGIPMLFQGQEFLEDDWFHDQDPIDWSKMNQFAGILQLYKDLIALRLNRHGTTKGLTGEGVDVYHTDNKDNVIAFHRWFSGGVNDSVVVIANFSARTLENYPVGLPAAGEWKVRFNSDSDLYDEEFANTGKTVVHGEAPDNATAGAGAPAVATVSIAAYSALILSQEE
ncbi:MAG: alpha-amylase family glycosyl hydrolase [Cyclonatronaceae bacterium]